MSTNKHSIGAVILRIATMILKTNCQIETLYAKTCRMDSNKTWFWFKKEVLSRKMDLSQSDRKSIGTLLSVKME